MHQTRTWTLRLLKIFGVTAGGFFLLVILLTTCYSGEMKQLIIGELNKTLKSPVEVKDIQFSLLQHFPYASIELNQVRALDAPAEGNKGTLLQAENISLLFNILGLLRNDVSIKRVVVKNGSLVVRIDKAGNDNYHIWNTSKDTTESVIDLHKILLDQVVVRYEDSYADQHYVMNVHEATLKGHFASASFTLEVNSAMRVEQMLIEKINYLQGKEVKVQTNLAVHYKQGLYRFEESKLKVADLDFLVKGDLIDDFGHQGLYTDLNIQTRNADLKEFLSMLPESYGTYFSRYKSHGNFSMVLALKGGGKKNPRREVKVDFMLKDGKITPKDGDLSLTAIQLQGSYHNNPGREDVLSIPHLSANLNGHPITAGLLLSRLSNPMLRLTAKAALNLRDIKSFIPTDTIESLDGTVTLDVAFAGKVKDMKASAAIPGKVQASGSLVLAHASLKLKNNPLNFNSINGTFKLHDHNLEIQSFTGNISSTDFEVAGMLNNFTQYLLIPGQTASLEGKIRSRNLNLDELMADKKEAMAGDTSYLLKFNPRLVCSFGVSVGHLHFRKFSASDLSGTIRLRNQVISGSDLIFASMGGQATMHATIDASRRDKVVMACDADVKNIDIRELFTEMENFDQQTLTDKNLRGRLTAAVKFSADWTTALDIKSSTAKAQCSIQIDNGELIGFTPVLALSKYLKVADLNSIRFSTLKNEVNIADRRIYIPAMEIKSSALNLTVSGVHDFDNMVDYKLKMLLSDVLGKKVKQQHTEFGDIEDDGLGRSQLFLAMKGPADNPTFTYDRKSVGDKIRNDLRADQQNVKQMLKEEFGFFKKDTTRTEAKKKKKEELQVDWSGSE